MNAATKAGLKERRRTARTEQKPSPRLQAVPSQSFFLIIHLFFLTPIVGTHFRNNKLVEEEAKRNPPST